MESFVANYYCKMCSAHKEKMQVMVMQDDELMRTEESYERVVRSENLTLIGVKEHCVFFFL